MGYEREKVIRSLRKIVGHCFARETMLFPIFLIPCICAILYANHLSILASKKLGRLLAGETTLVDYCTTFISSKFVVILVTAVFDVTISRIFAFALRLTVRDFANMERQSFKKQSLGHLTVIQYTKAEAVSVLVYTVVPYLFNDVSFFVQGLFQLYGVNRGAFLCLMATVTAHLALSLLLMGGIARRTKRYEDAKFVLSSIVTNEAENYDIIKTFHAEEQSLWRVSQATQTKRKSENNLNLFKATAMFFLKTLEIMTILALLLLNSEGKLDGEVIFIIDLCCNIHDYLHKFFEHLSECNSKFYLYHTIDNAPEYEQVPCIRSDEGHSVPEDGPNMPAIEFRNVSTMGLINNLSFKINKNEKIAIVGAQNAGKTLLINSIVGLNQVDGEILINGRESFSKQEIAFAPQVASYLKGSVMENLQYGSPLSDEEIVDRCRHFGLDDVFRSLEDGYDRVSPTGGTALSGGQKQRVNVARALMKDSPIMLFDNSFNNINAADAKSLINKIIKEENKTVLVVVPGADMLHLFDRIILLDRENAFFGTYEELKNRIN